MPSLDHMGDVNTDVAVNDYPMSNAPGLTTTSPSFIMGIAKGADGPDLDVHLTHLKILQPKVAA